MEISFKEIILKRISFKDTELLRKWRNDDFIAKHMYFQKNITTKMQTKWFQSLDNDTDYYFKIMYKNIPIGLINLKNIDWQTKEGEAGLYIAIEKYRNSPLAVYSSLSFLQYFFEQKGILLITAKVKKTNINTIKYNTSLGFEKIEAEKYALSRIKYIEFTKKIIERIG